MHEPLKDGAVSLLARRPAAADAFPPGKCVHEWFEAQVERSPDAVAVVFEQQRLTYRELSQRANRLARHLQLRGVGADTLVGVCLEPSLDLLVAIFGVLKAGGAYVPLDPNYPPDRIAYMLEKTQAPVLIQAETKINAFVASPGVKIVQLGADAPAIASQSSENLSALSAPENLIYVIFTSGSTGQPKGAAVRHGGFANLLQWFVTDFKICETDHVLLCSSISFDLTQKNLFAPLLAGGTLYLCPPGPYDADLLARLIHDHGVTLINCTPSAFYPLLERGNQDAFRSLTTLMTVFLGGETISIPRVRPWLNHPLCHAEIANTYGPTECADICSFYRLTRGNLNQYEFVPLGRPIANVQVVIVDGAMELCPPGTAGELCIGGAGVGAGYINDPEMTAKKFLPNPFPSVVSGKFIYRTGDRARTLADGNVEFLGRMDHQVKIRGYRIELGEIESALNTHPNIQSAVVIIRADQADEKFLVAYLIPRRQPAPSVFELRRHLLAKIPDYMVPAVFSTLESFPLNPNGKVDRQALSVLVVNRLGSGAEYVAPRTATEAKLATIWQELIGLERVGVHDNFFALGGHSLLAVRMVFRIREELQIDLPVKVVWESPTIAGLSRAVATIGKSEAAGRPRQFVRPSSGETFAHRQFPASFSQEQLWFLDQLEPGSPMYNVPLAIRLQGKLDQVALRQSLNHLIQRHEALRTTFAGENGVPRQVVAPELTIELPVVKLESFSVAERAAAAHRLMLQSAEKPFDLQLGPLVRAELFQLNDEHHILLLTIHHIVFDGWSIEVLLRDLTASYPAFCAGGQPEPAGPPMQFADFAVWQREFLTPEKVEEHLAYWRQQLDGVPTTIDLPTKPTRPAAADSRGDRKYFSLRPELTNALRELGRPQGTTLFVTLLAAFHALLHRFSGQQSILVGSPMSGRTLMESENSIGFFVNMLPLKADFFGDPQCVELLQQVHKTVWEAHQHQELPFEKLVAELQPRRDLNRNPIFQTAFVFEIPSPVLSQPMNGLTLGLDQVRPSVVKFDLTLTLVAKNEGLEGLWEYATGTFEAETIARLSESYQMLLESMVASPQQKISELALLTTGERQAVLEEWNQTASDYPRNSCIHELFEAQAKIRPDAVAVASPGGDLTYRELNERANQLAHHLRSLGVHAETPVGILLGRSVDYVVSVLAILKAGGAYVPLDLDYPPDRLNFMLSDSGCQVVVTNKELKLPGLTELNLVLAATLIAASPKTNPVSVTTAESLAYVIYTSGSTGRPKGVAILHRGVIRLVRGQHYASFDPSQRFLLLAAITFDASTFELWGALLNGGGCVIHTESASDYAQLEKVIREQQVTCALLTTSLFHQVIELRPSLLQPLKQLLVGGEALAVKPARKALQLLPHLRLINAYGPTECTTIACCLDVPKNFTGESVPIGRPIANTKCYVLDAQLQPVPIGVAGELYLGGDGLARGYLNQPELTAEKFIPDPFSQDPTARLYKTGDRVRWQTDGNLEFLGRLDEQVKLRGFRIELGEIESVLATHPSIRECVVTVRNNPAGEKSLVAYFVVQAPVPTLAELRTFLLRSLPDYMVPASFVNPPALPLTAHGKVDRVALPAPADNRLTAGIEFIAPRNATETRLAEIWRELLALPQVGVHDNFFTLGGHSLLAVRMVNEIKRRMAFDLPIRMVFQHPTIQELARILPAQKNTERKPELIQLQAGTAGAELFFLIDEGSLGLLKLAHFLDKDLRLYASVMPIPEATLRAAANKDFSALPRMEDWAAKHVALIRSREITGPIRLAGHCFGGMLAFEVARQLQAAGIQVETVFLLDTWMTMPTFWGEKKAWLQEHVGKLLKQGPQYLWRKSRRRIDLEKKELVTRIDLAASDDFNQQIPWVIISRIYWHAMFNYQPRPLASRGILFISQDDWMSNAFRPKDNTLGANRVFSGGVTVEDVPGNHVTALNESHLPALAEHYNRHLKPSP